MLRLCVSVHTAIAEKNHWWWSVGRTHIVKESKENKEEQLLLVYYVVVLGRAYKGVPQTGQTPSLLVCFQIKRALAKWLGCIILLPY